MDIIKAYAKNNLCYIASQKMVPKGIVVHSTGANNPWLKRYVDCPKEVGKNSYGNHWNVAKPSGSEKCVHAFIGYDKNKNVRVAEILPPNICCWGVGQGTKGSYNYNPSYIQFEICEDDLKDKDYYKKAFQVAAEYCACLCEKHGLKVNKIVSHKEAHKKGYGSNHSDPEHWMKNFDESMDDFRNKVSKLLKNNNVKSDSKKSTKKITQSTSVKICNGDLVSISKNAKYYNGDAVPNWVKCQKWYVKGTPKDGRAVIDKNEEGTNSICSPINTKYLKVVKTAAKSNKFSGKKSNCPYQVKVTVSSLDIRKSAGNDKEKVGCITDKGVYTITKEKTCSDYKLWGKLKSGAGWICLEKLKKL